MRASNPPKRWEVGVVTLIVSAPFYLWFFPSLFLNKLPPLRVVIAIFWIYLIVGFFIVKSILRRLAKGKGPE
jgi:hypothetical protein